MSGKTKLSRANFLLKLLKDAHKANLNMDLVFEYIEEAEDGEGYGYWKTFFGQTEDGVEGALEDIRGYIAEAEKMNHQYTTGEYELPETK